MSSITLKGIRKVYPIADDIKKKKKKLKKGTTYYFRVVAVGKFGKKTWKSNNTASSSIELE